MRSMGLEGAKRLRKTKDRITEDRVCRYCTETGKEAKGLAQSSRPQRSTRLGSYALDLVSMLDGSSFPYVPCSAFLKDREMYTQSIWTLYAPACHRMHHRAFLALDQDPSNVDVRCTSLLRCR